MLDIKREVYFINTPFILLLIKLHGLGSSTGPYWAVYAKPHDLNPSHNRNAHTYSVELENTSHYCSRRRSNVFHWDFKFRQWKLVVFRFFNKIHWKMDFSKEADKGCDYFHYLTINGRSLCLSVCLSVCPSSILTTVHPIDFTLGGCIAEDPRKCSVECEVVWMSGTGGQAFGPFPNRHALNGHCATAKKEGEAVRHTEDWKLPKIYWGSILTF